MRWSENAKRRWPPDATISIPSRSSLRGWSARSARWFRKRSPPDARARRHRVVAGERCLHDRNRRHQRAGDPGVHPGVRDEALSLRYMMRRQAIAVPFVLAASLPCAIAAPPGAPNPLIRKMTSEISAERIEARIRRLAAFGTRNSLSDTQSETRGIGAARRWIKA